MTTADTLARFQAEYQIPQSITVKRQGEQLRELQRLAATLDHPLIELTQQDVLNYLGVLLAPPRSLSPNTVRWISGMLRSFVTWGTNAGLIETERARLLKLIGPPRGSSGNSTPNPYKPGEIARFRTLLAEKYPTMPRYGRGSQSLKRYLDGRKPALRGAAWRHARRLQFEAQLALTLELGLRSIEMLRLSIDAAHYDNDTLVVVTAKTGPGKPKLRAIPWTPHARACVQEWLEFRKLIAPPNDSLWVTLGYLESAHAQLTPLTPDTMHHSLGKAFGPGWRWHRFRHTAATEWLRAKMPLEKVQVLMGHSRIEQTREYTEILNADITDAMADAQEAFSKRMGLAA